MDGGAEKPVGFGVSERLYDLGVEIGKLLKPIGAVQLKR